MRFQNVHTTFKKNEFDIGAYVNVVNAGGFLYSLICILFYVKNQEHDCQNKLMKVLTFEII